MNKSPVRLLKTVVSLGASLALAGFSAGAQALPSDSSTGLYVQGGHNILHGGDTDNLFVGVMVPFGTAHSFAGTQLTWYLDAYYGQWRGDRFDGTSKTYNQVGALAVGRFRFDQGQSPFFAEAGLGGSYLDDVYNKPGPFPGGRTQSSRWNFAIRFGGGYSFGERKQHELGLYWQHFSNAGLKRPNPGEDFIQARYAYRF